jgi:2-polyprenyl-3-methyl-5-hydroxy-6-metoxy-1,4-benzoquinol methylase
MLMENSKDLWDRHWLGQEISARALKRSTDDEMASVRWRKIEDEVLTRYGSFTGLEVLELGAGAGTVSLIMRLKGADVTLIDYSPRALERAQLLFRNFNCTANFLKADCLNLPSELLGKFDISMSFGLAEHFIGKERAKIFIAHSIALKDNGISFISVPNRYCLPYRLWKKGLELRRAWLYGREVPFTAAELRRMASSAGYRDNRILGSSFFRSLDQFLLLSIFSRLGINTEKKSFLDNFFGYALVLAGYK